MDYYDQHLHTYFSFDSQERFENYLANNPSFLVTTEHLDPLNPASNYQDDYPDYEQYCLEIDRLNQSQRNRVLKGIEIGYLKQEHEAITSYLSDKFFDLKLLSFHHNGVYDYMDDAVLSKSASELIHEYYTLMLEGLKQFGDAQVLAHFDYGLRRFDISAVLLQREGETLLREIFTWTVQRGMAFELNSKSMYQYHKFPLYDYAISLYQQVGGTLFTLGSDAHTAAMAGSGFDMSKSLLKNHQVTHLTVFQKGKPIPIAL